VYPSFVFSFLSGGPRAYALDVDGCARDSLAVASFSYGLLRDIEATLGVPLLPCVAAGEGGGEGGGAGDVGAEEARGKAAEQGKATLRSPSSRPGAVAAARSGVDTPQAARAPVRIAPRDTAGALPSVRYGRARAW